MILTAPDVSSLAASLEHWEWAEYAACALVALGCTGEYIAEFTGYWTGGLQERKDRLAKRSTLLLISALALELVCLFKTNSISGMLIGSLSEKAGAAEIKAQSAFDKSALAESRADNAGAVAGDALTDSKTARETAGKAQEKTAEVAKQTGELLMKVTGAETKLLMLQPRMKLLMRQECSLVNKVKPFAGQKIVIRTNRSGIRDPNDIEETHELATTITWLLGRVSSWSVSEAQGDNGWGVTLSSRRNPSPKTKNAGTALASALGDCGLTNMQGARPVFQIAEEGSVIDRENEPDTIVLYIGEHPH